MTTSARRSRRRRRSENTPTCKRVALAGREGPSLNPVMAGARAAKKRRGGAGRAAWRPQKRRRGGRGKPRPGGGRGLAPTSPRVDPLSLSISRAAGPVVLGGKCIGNVCKRGDRVAARRCMKQRFVCTSHLFDCTSQGPWWLGRRTPLPKEARGKGRLADQWAMWPRVSTAIFHAKAPTLEKLFFCPTLVSYVLSRVASQRLFDNRFYIVHDC